MYSVSFLSYLRRSSGTIGANESLKVIAFYGNISTMFQVIAVLFVLIRAFAIPSTQLVTSFSIQFVIRIFVVLSLGMLIMMKHRIKVQRNSQAVTMNASQITSSVDKNSSVKSQTTNASKV